MKEGDGPVATRRTSGHSHEPALQVVCLVCICFSVIHDRNMAANNI
jgi:hypothetical protein